MEIPLVYYTIRFIVLVEPKAFILLKELKSKTQKKKGFLNYCILIQH